MIIIWASFYLGHILNFNNSLWWSLPYAITSVLLSGIEIFIEIYVIQNFLISDES